MSFARADRVQEALRQEISKIIQGEIKDPRLGFLTITSVEITRDLRHARVYFSVLGEERDKKLALKGLNSAKGYIKGLLSDRIKLKFMPELEFKIDNSYENTKRVFEILDNLNKEKQDAEGDRGHQET